MAAIIRAAGEYFVGDHDKAVAIYSILYSEHCCRKKSDEIILKAARQKCDNVILCGM